MSTEPIPFADQGERLQCNVTINNKYLQQRNGNIFLDASTNKPTLTIKYIWEVVLVELQSYLKKM